MKKYIKYIIISLLAIALILFGVNEYINGHVAVTEYIYENSKIPASFNNYKIMVISDIHNAAFDDDIITIAQNNKPDIILFCGDMVQLPDDRTTAVCSIGDKLGKDYDIYAVSGNHETQNYSYDTIMEELREHNITPVENDTVCVEKDGEQIVFAGLKDLKDDYITPQQYEKARKIINSFFEDTNTFSVLLNHRADMYPEIKDCGADLIISGHMHGGIIRLPFAGGVIGSDDGLFPDYEYGFFEGGNSSDMIVSGGCDQNPKKKRVFNPPEVLIITLKSE